jgi:hypothetical protein
VQRTRRKRDGDVRFCVPQESIADLLLEGKTHWLPLLQVIKLGEVCRRPSKMVWLHMKISCRSWRLLLKAKAGQWLLCASMINFTR